MEDYRYITFNNDLHIMLYQKIVIKDKCICITKNEICQLYLNYHGFELCYYGRYGDEMEIAEQIKSIPPLPPNHSLINF